jgi:hypothetical protein
MEPICEKKEEKNLVGLSFYCLFSVRYFNTVYLHMSPLYILLSLFHTLLHSVPFPTLLEEPVGLLQ